MDFSQLNKRQAKSFIDQKTLVKTVLQGKPISCNQCNHPLSAKFSNPGEIQVSCKQGCTLITLEID